MRAEDVPAAWMEAADCALVPGKPMTTSDLRKAFAAVAPLIAAQERERCARVADETTAPHNIYKWPDAIAAAIRARGAA